MFGLVWNSFKLDWYSLLSKPPFGVLSVFISSDTLSCSALYGEAILQWREAAHDLRVRRMVLTSMASRRSSLHLATSFAGWRRGVQRLKVRRARVRSLVWRMQFSAAGAAFNRWWGGSASPAADPRCDTGPQLTRRGLPSTPCLCLLDLRVVYPRFAMLLSTLPGLCF